MKPPLCQVWRALTICSVCYGLAAEPAFASNAADNLTCEIFLPRNAGILSTCTGPFPGTAADIEISLFGAAPNAVRELRVAMDGGAQEVQHIGIDVRPVIDIETVGILFMDMNFDGFSDIAVMKSLDTGYRYFVYDPAGARFVASPELDKVAWPEFDAARGTVTSFWQRDDGTFGHKIYVWNGDRLELQK